MKHIRANPVVVLRGVPVLMILGGAAADLFGPEPYLGLPFLASAPLEDRSYGAARRAGHGS